MTIARNPKKDVDAARFIRGARKTDGAGARRKLVPVWVNLDQELLDRVNEMAKAMGLNRSAFIVNAVAEKLRQLEQKQ
jgi:post-segregation antitoxin (ccd killing protein)